LNPGWRVNPLGWQAGAGDAGMTPFTSAVMMRIMGLLGTVCVEVKKELERRCKQMGANERRFSFCPSAPTKDSFFVKIKP
jgi:hypothetical protein